MTEPVHSMSDQSALDRAAVDRGVAARLRELTPARVGLGRTGVSQQTRDLLEFQRCHAQARDAVHATMQPSALAAAIRAVSGSDVICLHSAAKDRPSYLQRPDLGRRLDEPSRAILSNFNRRPFELAFVVTDGLSALAVERHSAQLVAALLPLISNSASGEWKLAPICIVEQGRVAIGDEIGSALGAEIVLVLIGERPGLSSPDSLGAYITWHPRVGRTDAERNCISNIRLEGLSYAEAARQIALCLSEARRRELTGVALKIESAAQTRLQSA